MGFFRLSSGATAWGEGFGLLPFFTGSCVVAHDGQLPLGHFGVAAVQNVAEVTAEAADVLILSEGMEPVLMSGALCQPSQAASTRDETQGNPVVAVALAGGPGPVIEHMALVSATPPAVVLGAGHDQLEIRLCDQCIG